MGATRHAASTGGKNRSTSFMQTATTSACSRTMRLQQVTNRFRGCARRAGISQHERDLLPQRVAHHTVRASCPPQLDVYHRGQLPEIPGHALRAPGDLTSRRPGPARRRRFRLREANGQTARLHPFAGARSRHLHYNYEPTFIPGAGGFIVVVSPAAHPRGNQLSDCDAKSVHQASSGSPRFRFLVPKQGVGPSPPRVRGPWSGARGILNKCGCTYFWVANGRVLR